MFDPESLALKDILLAEGICSDEQISAMEDEFITTGKPLAQMVIDAEYVSELGLLEMIASNLGTEVVDLSDFDIEKQVIDAVDPGTAHAYGIIPVALDSHSITVAARNPLNYQLSDELRFILNKDIFIVLAPEAQIDKKIETYYPMSTSMEDVFKDFGIEELSGVDIEHGGDVEKVANDTSIVKLVDAVMFQAIQDKASDIHFEPFEKEFKIRYRIDGALYEMAPPSKSLAAPMISRIKILSGLNISERRLPQDGRIQMKVGGKPIDLRVSTLPTAYGESVVLRILDRSVVNLDLDVLGIGEDVLRTMRSVIHRPNGIFVVTGPTGSGKTTTLYSCLKEVNTVGDKILTAEDPVEYDIEGIVQLPINDAVDMTFARALRAFLRQDPDIIMLGEIRDLETATMAVQASLTGHFVFSTLHTNDAAGAVTRLIDMGVEPFLVNSALVAVLGQRLIRRVCPSCKIPFSPTDEDLESLGISREDVGDRQFYYGKGCKVCGNSGYKGRKSITEILMVDNSIRALILKIAPTMVIRERARELGMRTIREDGVRSILNGETTMEEVLKYT